MARGVIPWAGACVSCRRAIQSADGPDGFAWEDADGSVVCVANRAGHQPERPGELDDVRTEPAWVQRQTSAGWEVPDGWRFENLGQCRTCYTEVAWCWTPAGNRAPVEKDGTPHFARCPQASTWRRR